MNVSGWEACSTALFLCYSTDFSGEAGDKKYYARDPGNEFEYQAGRAVSCCIRNPSLEESRVYLCFAPNLTWK